MQLGILNDTCVEHARVYSRATVPMIGQAAARQGQSTQLTEHSPLGADQASNKERQQAVWDRTAVDRLSVTYRMRSIPPWFAVGYRTSREIPVYIHRTRGARFPLQERERRELPGWQQCNATKEMVTDYGRTCRGCPADTGSAKTGVQIGADTVHARESRRGSRSEQRVEEDKREGERTTARLGTGAEGANI